TILSSAWFVRHQTRVLPDSEKSCFPCWNPILSRLSSWSPSLRAAYWFLLSQSVTVPGYEAITESLISTPNRGILMIVKNIFICYRRDDAEGYAGRIFDRLN